MGTENFKRASWAANALQIFTAETYGGRTVNGVKKDGNLETAIQDLISNLMHLASHHGLDPGDLVEMAQRNYKGEVLDNE